VCVNTPQYIRALGHYVIVADCNLCSDVMCLYSHGSSDGAFLHLPGSLLWARYVHPHRVQSAVHLLLQHSKAACHGSECRVFWVRNVNGVTASHALSCESCIHAVLIIVCNAMHRFVARDCTVTCWKGKHNSYLVVSAIGLAMYLPAAFWTAYVNRCRSFMFY